MNVHNSSESNCINHLPSRQHDKHPLRLIYESGARRASIDQDILCEALSRPVLVMDAGNCFNPLRLVRPIRQRTLQVHQILEHIQVARAFTCFQVVALLEKTKHPPGPVFILRLLTTFSDEMVPVYERLRLLRAVDSHIHRLQAAAVVTVMVRNSPCQEEPLLDWLSALQSRAQQTVYPNLPPPPAPAPFF